MLTWSMIEYLLYLLVPVLLIRYVNGRNTKANGLVRDTRRTRIDYLVYGSLVLSGALYIYTAHYLQPANIFKELEVTPTTPCFMLRRTLADLGQQNPSMVPSSGVPTQKQKASSGFDRLAYYQGSEFGRKDHLVDRFCKFSEDRELYLKFGEAVYMESVASDFGESGLDTLVSPTSGSMLAGVQDTPYTIRAAASQFTVYLPVLLLVGILTTPFMATRHAPSRAVWRPWAVTVVCTLYFADLYALLTTPGTRTSRLAKGSALTMFSPDQTDPMEFFADSATYTRRVLLGVCCLAFVAMDLVFGARESEVVLLRECVDEQAQLLAVTKNHTMLETAVMLSEPLRDRLVALWRKEEMARERLFGSSEFQNDYATEIERTQSQRWVDQTRGAALHSLGLAK